MSDPCNIISIPNPFAGKPVYVPASAPCDHVCKPCELQPVPEDEDEETQDP